MKGAYRSAAAGEQAIDALARRAASSILERVRRGGDRALRALTERFDGASRRDLEIGPRERRHVARGTDAATRAAIRLAAARIAAFARLQKRSIRPFRRALGGVVLEQRLLPVERVGIYAPGGRYPLCSTVLMAAIPARIAGCREVVLCTPPRRDGSIAPEILEAAAAARVDRVFAVGGAQAIAALAFGTETIPAVDLVVGPGNRFVAAAKALVAGRVGIDFPAGPTELLVIADAAADARRVAADLVAQAEHDPEAFLVLLLAGPGAGRGVLREVRSLLARVLPPGTGNRAAAARALARLDVRRCRSVEEACRVADRVAPEHLSLQIASPRRAAARLRCYGSLFLGGASAVALGDYVTGPNHILPTAGAARHTGGLSVLRFLKVVTVQEIQGAGRGSKNDVRRLSEAAARLASKEGLLGHEESIACRTGRLRPAAVLFDFNGVLMDDEEYHWRAFRAVLAPLGIALSRKRYDRRYLAFDDATALRAMLQDAGRAGALYEDLLRRKRRLFRRLCEEHVRIEAPVVRLIRRLARRAPLAIVSGAARLEIVRALRQARIAREFRAIVSSEDVGRCKPDPEGYLLGLRRLGIGKGDGSVAVEDSPGGIRAARAAGLRVVGVATSYAPGVLRRAGAMRVARTLGDLTPARILRAGRLRGRPRRPSGPSRSLAPRRRRKR